VAIQKFPQNAIVFVYEVCSTCGVSWENYCEHSSWQFSLAFAKHVPASVSNAIGGHEALPLRTAKENGAYSHEAMMFELRSRLGLSSSREERNVEDEVKEEEEVKMTLPVNVEQSQVMTNTMEVTLVTEKNKLAAVEKELALFKQKASESASKLIASENKLIASESKLMASESKLMASESKLIASESKLLASESKLIASESKLTASEKEVKRLRESRTSEGEHKSSTNETTSRMQWAPDNSSSSCTLCSSTFNIWRRRHHCRSCGCLCCSSCSPKRSVNNSTKLLRVCKNCANGL
jgi:hypothetical protein